MERKTFAVLGLGIFGSSLARDLTRYGHEVIAIDKNLSETERMKDDVTTAIALDFTDIDQLKEAGIDNFDYGIITTGSMLEETIMGILNLKELGVKRIIVKAKNRKYSDILSKIGADETVSPEKDVAKSIAKKLTSSNVLELFDLGNNVSIFEFKVPSSWAGHSLIELNLRSEYNVNVVAIRRNMKMDLNIDPNEKLLEGDVLLMAGDDSFFKKLSTI